MPAKGAPSNNQDGAPVKLDTNPKRIRNQIIGLAGIGFTQELIAENLGVSLATFKRYLDKHPDLRPLIKQRRSNLKKQLAETIWARAFSSKASDKFLLDLSKTHLWKESAQEVKVTHSSTDLILQSMKIAGSPDDDDTIEAELEDAT